MTYILLLSHVLCIIFVNLWVTLQNNGKKEKRECNIGKQAKYLTNDYLSATRFLSHYPSLKNTSNRACPLLPTVYIVSLITPLLPPPPHPPLPPLASPIATKLTLTMIHSHNHLWKHDTFYDIVAITSVTQQITNSIAPHLQYYSIQIKTLLDITSHHHTCIYLKHEPILSKFYPWNYHLHSYQATHPPMFP